MTQTACEDAIPVKAVRGGYRPGAGRKPQMFGLLTRGRIIGILDDHGPAIVERLVELCESKNEGVAVRACIALINKMVPDSVEKERSQSRNFHFLSNDIEEKAYQAERLCLEKETGGYLGTEKKD